MYQIGIHLFDDRDTAMTAQFRARASAMVVPVDSSAPRGRFRPLTGDDVAAAVITHEPGWPAADQHPRALMEVYGLVKRQIDDDIAKNGYPLPGRYWLVTWWHS